MRLYLEPGYNLSVRLALNRRDADRLIEEAFWAAFRNLGDFDLSQPFWPWFRQIIVQQYWKLRRKSRWVRSFFPFIASSRFDPDLFQISGTSPQLALRRQEEKEILLRALGQLPENQRLVLILFDLEGLNLKEIAALLNVPTAVVLSRLHGGRLRMRNFLLPYFKEDK